MTNGILLTGTSNKLLQTGTTNLIIQTGVQGIPPVSTAGGKSKKRGVALTDNEPYLRQTRTVMAESVSQIAFTELNKSKSKITFQHKNFIESVLTPFWKHGGFNFASLTIIGKHEAHSKLERLTESKSTGVIQITHRLPELVKDITMQKESMERLKKILKIQSLISSL